MLQSAYETAVAEYMETVKAATGVYEETIRQADARLQAFVQQSGPQDFAPQKGETVEISRERLQQLEEVAAAVANNPELVKTS